MKCSVDSCKISQISKGYCDKHYRRVKKYGSVELPLPVPKQNCSVKDCGIISKTKGLCIKHYTRLLRYNDPDIVSRNYISKRECNQCGLLYKPYSSKCGIKYCSTECYIKSITGKPRKEFRMSWGYKYKLLPEHPDSDKKGYIAEHRLVAEKKIGRRLHPDEVVHHINEDRKDNRPDNLYVCNRVEHALIHKHKKSIITGQFIKQGLI